MRRWRAGPRVGQLSAVPLRPAGLYNGQAIPDGGRLLANNNRQGELQPAQDVGTA